MRERLQTAASAMRDRAATPKGRRAVLPVLIVVAAALFAGYLQATRPVLNPAVPEERVWTVAVVEGRAADVRPELRAFGEIVAGREVDLRPLVAGRVVEVGANFRNGGIVRRGELLVAIDPFDYQAAVDEAKAEIAEAEARHDEIQADLLAEQAMLATSRDQLGLRQRELTRRQTLVDKGSGSKKSLDDAAIARNEERRKVQTARRDIDMLAARAAQQDAALERLRIGLRRAERELEETRLLAPFDGFLTDTDIAIGKRIGTGDRVARLFDAGSLEARFHLSDTQYSRLLAGRTAGERPVRILWRIGATEKAFDAIIEQAEGRIDSASGGVELYAAIAGTGPETLLRPGAFIEARIADRVYPGVYVLPENAVHDGSVYVIGPEGRLEARPAAVVLRDRERTLVTGDLEGQRIVVTDFAEIGPGLLARAVE
jgi:multidrug efflux pump subunit AcrA (membrane-fusion protein)